MPASLCMEMDRISRNFLWGSSDQTQKIYNVNWNMVTQSKEHGGLNLKPARVINQAFILKLAWRMVTSQQSLWVRVLQGKYIKGDSLNFAISKKSNLSSLWSRLLDFVPVLHRCCSMSIGADLETNFLYDNWLESTGPLINHMSGVEEEFLQHLNVNKFYNSPFVIENG